MMEAIPIRQSIPKFKFWERGLAILGVLVGLLEIVVPMVYTNPCFRGTMVALGIPYIITSIVLVFIQKYSETQRKKKAIQSLLSETSDINQGRRRMEEGYGATGVNNSEYPWAFRSTQADLTNDAVSTTTDAKIIIFRVCLNILWEFNKELLAVVFGFVLTTDSIQSLLGVKIVFISFWIRQAWDFCTALTQS